MARQLSTLYVLYEKNSIHADRERLQDTINSIKTIYLFTNAYPAVLSGTRASALLSYLKNPSTVRNIPSKLDFTKLISLFLA